MHGERTEVTTEIASVLNDGKNASSLRKTNIRYKKKHETGGRVTLAENRTSLFNETASQF
jgi:hypothetical protein